MGRVGQIDAASKKRSAQPKQVGEKKPAVVGKQPAIKSEKKAPIPKKVREEIREEAKQSRAQKVKEDAKTKGAKQAVVDNVRREKAAEASSAQQPEETKVRRKSRPGALAAAQTRLYRKNPHIKALRAKPYRELIRASLPKHELSSTVRLQPSAVKMLQQITESSLTELLEEGLLIALRCNRVTVDANDLRVARMIRRGVDIPVIPKEPRARK